MKLVAYPLAAMLGALGVIFLAGAQGQVMRVVVGGVLLVAAGALLWLVRQSPVQSSTTVVQKIDLSGDVNLEQMTCRSCGGTLSNDSISVRGGGIFVQCEFCGSAYQLEEEPKW